MRARRGAAAIILGVVIAAVGFAIARSQALGRPNDMVWQTAASGSSLRSVYATADGRHGWVVGTDGTILATEDGGGHWTPETSSTSNNLRGIVVAADGRRGWVVGDNGTILATEDRGEHW